MGEGKTPGQILVEAVADGANWDNVPERHREMWERAAKAVCAQLESDLAASKAREDGLRTVLLKLREHGHLMCAHGVAACGLCSPCLARAAIILTTPPEADE